MARDSAKIIRVKNAGKLNSFFRPAFNDLTDGSLSDGIRQITAEYYRKSAKIFYRLWQSNLLLPIRLIPGLY